MRLLDNPVRPYAWGSTTAIPELLGLEPTGEPQAELWIGAHPASPSAVLDDDHTRRPLVEVIAADPAGELGPECLAAFGPRLPFLLKVLAAETPLSLQAHPNPEQAREGFAREDAAGIPLDAPHRSYVDADAKPELICALTPFEALVGFAPPAETLRRADRLDVTPLESFLVPLRDRPDAAGLRATFTALMEAPADRRQGLVDAVLARCRDVVGKGVPEADLLRRLGDRFPGDPGVVAALLLNHVVLAPGEALYLPAGNLHAYVHGVGVEIMANSDNVLRGGLTGKHVDLPELLRVLDFAPRPAEVLHPRDATAGGLVYQTPAREFRLSRLDVGPGRDVRLEPAGPQILLCTEGAVLAASGSGKVELTRGRSAYAGAAEGIVTLSGQGTAFRAIAGITTG